MAAIFQIRRGTTNETLADGELYLHKGSGSVQFGSGSIAVTLLPLNVPVVGNINLSGSISASGDIRLGGNIYLGDNIANDSVNVNSAFSGSIIPSDSNVFDLGSTTLKYRNVHATSISGAIAATNGVISGSSQIVLSLPQGVVSGSSQVIEILGSLNTYTGSVNTRLTEIGVITGSLILSASAAKSSNDSQDVSITNLNSYTHSLKGAIELTGSSITILGNLVVKGTQTILDSTTIQLGDNIIELNGSSNTNGGLLIKDPTGASTTSGSFLWDTTNDFWKAGKVGIESKLLLAGGDSVLSGSSQITLENVSGFSTFNTTLSTITGSLISSASAAKITNDSQDISITNLNTFSGSTLTRLSALEIETNNLEGFSSSVLTRLTQIGVVSGSLIASASTAVVANVNQNLFTQSANIRLNNIEAATSSYETNGRGIVSGSSQITYASISSIPSGIVSGSTQVTPLLPAGVVSGSSQVITNNSVTLGTHTTGNYIQTITGTANQITVAGSGLESADVTLSTPQNIHTSATPQFSSLGIGTAASGVSGEIRATADITAFYSSDERLKSNIQPISDALAKVNQISGNTYDWKNGFENIHSHTGTDIGVIAQEIEKVLPQIVTNRDNGYKAVQYEKIIPLLIEAIKELSNKIDKLENK